jgi:hypothetical protein
LRAEKSNAETYRTHFSAFDLSAISGFSFFDLEKTVGSSGQTTPRLRYVIGVESALSEYRSNGGTASNPEYQLTHNWGTVRK